jgi:hypothetical protein
MTTNIIDFLHTTAAYQTAIVQILTLEAGKLADKLNLAETRPPIIMEAEAQLPPFGIAGIILTTNYTYVFSEGRLTEMEKRLWLGRVTPSTNIHELASVSSLISSNGAYQIATQTLAVLGVDVSVLEKRLPPGVHQLYVRNPIGTNVVTSALGSPTPLFFVSWGGKKPPMDRFNPVYLKILGSTREVVQLVIRDQKVFTNAPLVLTNTADLLGPAPPKRHFVESFFGGAQAYGIVEAPDETRVTLITDQRVTTGEKQDGPFLSRGQTLKLTRKQAAELSARLLDFSSFAWLTDKLCSPDYGVRVEFVRSSKSVEVLLCFECDILRVTTEGHSREEDFDPAHNELARFMQALFPEDKEIQSIKLDVAK